MLERITRREEADLFMAWMAISISFAIIKIAPYGFLGPMPKVLPLDAVVFFGIALITVGIGFILHEMAHKFAAIRYGYWAEFRKNDVMLLVAVVMAALVGFVFAAPGATVIYSKAGDSRGLSREEDGIISASGPAINLLLCIPFAAMILVAGGLAALKSGNLLAVIGLAGIQINAMLATFNLLPFSILDGNKVLAWSIPAFILLIAVSFAVLVGSFSI
jgi:Zn-dependent protease